MARPSLRRGLRARLCCCCLALVPLAVSPAAPPKGGGAGAGEEAAGRGDVHVFAYADAFGHGLCHLADSVESAGGLLQVLGLVEGRSATLPGGPLPTEGEVAWPVADTGVYLKKHLFLSRALRHIPDNATVVFLDAFDTVLQRPLSDLVEAYRRIVREAGAASRGGLWPVVFGGEYNCWPFPHDGRIEVRGPAGGGGGARGREAEEPRFHVVPADANISGEHHGDWSYNVGRGRAPVAGGRVCGEWLSRFHPGLGSAEHGSAGAAAAAAGRAAGPPSRYPFLCSGVMVGTAASMRRLLRRLFALYERTGEYYDQALLQLLLLQSPELGLVDSAGRLALHLHGVDEASDLQRPLCRGSYFERARRAPAAPLEPRRSLAGGGLRAPGLRGRRAEDAPPVLHFNGNGKRHLWRCAAEFQAAGATRGGSEDDMSCWFFNHDRRGLENRHPGVRPRPAAAAAERRWALEVAGSPLGREWRPPIRMSVLLAQ